MSGFRVVTGSWEDCANDAVPVRQTVFVQEQNVPPEIELDEHDADSVHAVAYDASGLAIGTGRLLCDGHIGRVAVLAAWRGHGVGVALMHALMHQARARGFMHVELSAQCQARAFYEKLGFVAFGDTYREAGIEHVAMRCCFQPL